MKKINLEDFSNFLWTMPEFNKLTWTHTDGALHFHMKNYAHLFYISYHGYNSDLISHFPKTKTHLTIRNLSTDLDLFLVSLNKELAYHTDILITNFIENSNHLEKLSISIQEGQKR